MIETYKKIALMLFGGFVDKYSKNFESLKKYLLGANIRMLLRTWVCIIFLTVILSYVISLAAVFAVASFLQVGPFFFTSLVAGVPLLVALSVFFAFYLYPIQRSRKIQRSIETDLPFALAHINAIASSGIPPESMFELLTGFKEYREISEQANLIVRNIRTFGMSSISAISDVAERTPSQSFRQVLTGMTLTIERGGNLVDYLRAMSDKALFDYRIKREEYLKTLSTYADIYTALLVAAPLMMLAILGVMSIIGGEILGFGIPDIVNIITWLVLPFMNIGFLTFIHITYPGV